MSADYPMWKPPPGTEVDPTDLEDIADLVEIAAICLTDSQVSTFTQRQLFDQVHELAGRNVQVSECDITLVLKAMDSLELLESGWIRQLGECVDCGKPAPWNVLQGAPTCTADCMPEL